MEPSNLEYRIEFKKSVDIDEVISLLETLENKGFEQVKGALSLTIDMSEVHKEVQKLRSRGYTNNEILDEVLLLKSEINKEEN